MITLPKIDYSFSHFEIQRYVSQSQSNSGLINIYEYSDPRWKVTLTTRPLRYSDGQMIDAWFQSLRGGVKPVLLSSPHYCQPRAHIGNNGAEKQNGTLIAIENKTKLTIGGSNSSLQLSAGDYVSFSYNTTHALGMVLDASRNNANIIVNIEPSLPDYIKTGATVYFDRAEILTRPIWEDYEKWTWENRSVTFSFMESWK
ncbi:hypothetical protein [Bartonella tamiae]|uniref:Uncharacterized protein n=1 Tax=Bartonella tamiae Th239 TaxID=1094558 RepID=J1K2H6_9HYPH|nr:hypothetical protein [Bartonella tamiae]EJF91687.1 hypothetical protein ME5_00066 [Bartonella tamiae Th239]